MLDKAKSRVKELEDQRFELQGDRHRLMEKYSALTEQLQKMKDEHAVKQSIDNRIFKVLNHIRAIYTEQSIYVIDLHKV